MNTLTNERMPKLSTCKRMTVEAIGIDAYGFSRIARNGNDGECTGEQGKCGCIHAEIQLLNMMPNPVMMVVSHAPCLHCAKAIVNAGVRIVTYFKPYRLTDGIEYLTSNGVEVRKL